MATVEEVQVTGRKYRIFDAVNHIWKRISYWTKATDVELDNGTNLQDTIDNLNTTIVTINNYDAVQSEEITWYGTCSTVAGTKQKVVTTTNSKFTLVTGAKISVKFSEANTDSAPTLKVDNTTAVAIKAYGTTTPSSWWKAGDIVTFIYDGTNYIMGTSAGQVKEIVDNLSNITVGGVKANTLNFSLSSGVLTITTT